MSYRVRLNISWVFKKDMVPGTWHQDADFQRHAELLLLTHFQQYKPELDFTIAIDNGKHTLATLVWDVNLDDVPGTYHNPKDHVAAVEHHLSLLSYTEEVTVTDVLRHVDIASDEVKDHGIMLSEGIAVGQRPDSEDYPVFIPQPHPEAPDFNEVFLQDGFWWWNAVDSIQGVDFAGPAAGPVPEKIFKRWTDTTRSELYTAFKAKMDAAYPVTR